MKLKYKPFYRHRVLLSASLGVCALLVLLWPRLVENAVNLMLLKAWLNVRAQDARALPLQDGIPDGWGISIWGGQGRAIHARELAMAHSGNGSAFVHRTNALEAAVFTQRFRGPASAAMQCRVHSRGSAGFALIQQGGVPIGDTVFPARGEWGVTEWRFTSLSNIEPLELSLGKQAQEGTIWFDDVTCFLQAAPEWNLVANGGFEQDGLMESPERWWERHVGGEFPQTVFSEFRQIIETSSIRSVSRTDRLNMLDLLNYNFDKVRARMKKVSPGCGGVDGNPAIVIGLKEKIIRAAERAGYERALWLAQALMPQCPQPYGELARLYAGEIGNERAAELYLQAIDRALPGAQRGSYAFALGQLDMIWLGDLPRARRAFTTAKENPGWEGAPWYHGAADMYLGEINVTQGDCINARASYTRVLECSLCSARHAEARAALDSLARCRP